MKVNNLSERDTMENQVAYLIASVNRQLESELQERLRPEGIPIEQFRILSALSAQNGQSMGELAFRALVDTTTLSKIIDRMVVESLVYRGPDPSDRRKVLVFVAKKGTALLGRLQSVVGDQQRDIVDCLRSEKTEALRNLLKDLQQPGRKS